jgi:hypothetical protein
VVGVTPNKGKNLDCQDGDPSCDVDGVRNNLCVLGIGACLAQTNVPECTPQPVQKVTGTTCTGSACISMTPDGQCVDIKGGISQNCRANNTTQPCFPTGNPNGQIVRTGSAAPPTPPFPDPTYPKTGNVTLVATFCEGTSGATTVDLVTGLPGPGALVLPMTATWMP